MSNCDERITVVETTLKRHELTIYGDGNGTPGLVRKNDAISVKLDTIDKLLRWGVGIATAVLIGVLMLVAHAMLRMTYAPQQQSVNTSVSTPAGSVASPAADYTTADLAAKLGYSDREIQDRAAKGEIPGSRKDGKAWRFSRAAVDAWLAARAASAADTASADSAAKAANVGTP